MSTHCFIQVVLDTPLRRCFDYRWAKDNDVPQVGQLALVPWGKRKVLGLIVAVHDDTSVPLEKIKEAFIVYTQIPPLSSEWIALCEFTSSYYQRSLGEVALAALPKNIRMGSERTVLRVSKKIKESNFLSETNKTHADIVLNEDQQAAVNKIVYTSGFMAYVLYGVTGSGKTRVYLETIARMLAQKVDAQVLILVPEINLTPQLEAHIRAYFSGISVVSLHSGLAQGERMQSWMAAHFGQAQIVLGTRLAILSSLPRLCCIIVDEEHDISYKQQEGVRYSARDLAVWRARQLSIPVVLGSATPSLETWHHVKSGRYHLLRLPRRAVKEAVLPIVKMVDTSLDKAKEGLSQALIDAIKIRLERGEQSLLFLNRRGYAPVLFCDACAWISHCPRCTAFMVLHKTEHRLRCHHCSLELLIPAACPTCGNADIAALGRGTQRIEESLQNIFPGVRLIRIDADSTRHKGSAEAAFEEVHNGDVDILIGTQMVAKGHDFKRLTLVGVLNPDTALFSQDYRASERLFAQLVQVAGRAGRAEQEGLSEVLVQTRYPQHPLYKALINYDYEGFANTLLMQRQSSHLPPYIYQVLVRAKANQLEKALDFLKEAAALLEWPGIMIQDPIPMVVTRVANVERAQLLIESVSRAELQAFLKEWGILLEKIRPQVNWSLEVDPVDI